MQPALELMQVMATHKQFTSYPSGESVVNLAQEPDKVVEVRMGGGEGDWGCSSWKQSWAQGSKLKKKSSRLLATGTRNLVANSRLSVAKLRHKSAKGLETRDPSVLICHGRATRREKLKSCFFSHLLVNSLGAKPYNNLLKLQFSFYFRGNNRPTDSFKRLSKSSWNAKSKDQRGKRQRARKVGTVDAVCRTFVKFWCGKFCVGYHVSHAPNIHAG